MKHTSGDIRIITDKNGNRYASVEDIKLLFRSCVLTVEHRKKGEIRAEDYINELLRRIEV